MNYADWYTDRMDVWRTVEYRDGSITQKERCELSVSVPCRVYQSGKGHITMRPDAARLQGRNKLACGVSVDIRPGDELLITRGAAVNVAGKPVRYFAGEVQTYPEPFGAVTPGLAHKEVGILREERV